jgi:hypothetical protein
MAAIPFSRELRQAADRTWNAMNNIENAVTATPAIALKKPCQSADT